MRSKLLLIPIVVFIFCFTECGKVSAQSLLSGVNFITRDLDAADIVYDRNANVIYATVKSTAASNANSLLVLDPETLNIVDQVFIGSEPNKLAVSNDGSRVYIGVDEARAIRYYEPATGNLGPLQALLGLQLNAFIQPSPAIAEDILVSPLDPRVVIVSSDAQGTSAYGHLEVFNDFGRIERQNFFSSQPHSIAFLDQETLIGFGRNSFESTRFRFDGFQLTEEIDKRTTITTSQAKIETSGGLVFASNGQVMDPESLNILGRFGFRQGISAVEASAQDDLVYFMDSDYSFSTQTVTNSLSVYDTNTFLEIDSYTLDADSDSVRTLDFAGVNRLAYVLNNGEVGVISGVTIAAPPQPLQMVMGTSADDELVFDMTNRTATLNGTVIPVVYEVNTFRFIGKGGEDTVVYLGDEDKDEVAVMRSDLLSVTSEDFRFVARDCSDAEFFADSANDAAVIFDTVDDDQLLVTPRLVVLENSLARLVANACTTVHVVSSSGGDDDARFHGGAESIQLFANTEARRIRFGNENFSVTANGFEKAHMNGGRTNDDMANVVDSVEDDVFFANGNYGRFSNDSGVVYSFKEFEKLFLPSMSGNDIGIFQQSGDSATRENSSRTSMFGAGYEYNLFDFSSIIVNE